VSLTNAKATVLGASNVGGNLTVTDMVGSVTQNGALTVAGTSSFTTSTNNADITLTNAGNLLSGTVSLNTTGGTGNASLTNAKATDLGASTVGGNLTVTDSVGNLTQSGALTVGGTSSFTTSASSATITLNNANLLTGAASLNTSGASGNASLINAKATVLGASNVGGNLTVTDTVGNLTQTGVLTVAGTSSFTTSATDATITLTNAGNLLTGAASLNTSGTGGNASLTNNKATVLGDWNVGGNLVVTDRLGNLTQSGVLTVGGTSSFTTSASNATITLTNAGNLLTGAVSLNTSGASGNASLTNASATVLGASTVGGNLTVQTDSISVSGAVNASGQTVTFVPLTSTTAMTLGAAGGLALSQTSLDNITASTLVFGSTGSTGGITLGGPVTLATTGITNLSLITTGDITVNNPITVNNGANATLTLNTTGTATQSAAITAANLALLGTGGSYTLNNSGNLIATVAVNTGSVNLTTSEAVTIGTVGGTTGWTTTGNSTLTATGSTSDITVSNAVNWGNSSLLLDAGRNVAINAAMTGGSAGDLTALANGNLTIGAAGVITGKTVALSAIGAFINNRGSNAVSASDRWLVYSNAPDAPGENFGNLNSNNTAIWNNTYATLPPSSVTVPGNRYIFAFAPGSTPAALTVTSLNDSKTYGDTANLSLFTVSGFQAGVANAYLADPNVYSGTPGFFSAGAAAAANAGAYPIIVSQGTLAASGGYSFAFNNTGVLTANPKALTITANNVTQAFSNVPFSGGNGVIYNGLANGQNPSALSGTIMYGGTSQGAVNVGTYSIIPSGQTSSNYAITYVNGTLTITPLPMSVVLDALGAAANAAGTTAPSLTMNATILPTSPFSLPGNVAPFGGNSVLPYGNDTGAAGSSTNQQTSNTSGGSTNQQSSNTSDSRRRRREAR
jgi:hypothetical protein